MRKFTIILGFLALLLALKTPACTSILISGKATPDGRPILMKNRDTGHLSNMCLQVNGEKYRYVGIVNSEDLTPEEVWGGHNETGFAIINTANYNLNKKNEKEELEGVFMRIALATCATLEDFEDFLNSRPRPLCVNTNFGVIDAKGGCAYYEVGNEGYKKYDVNDPRIAPNGYLMRTNFGVSGERNKDQGNERFLAITEFMENSCINKQFDAIHLVRSIPRYLKHGLTHMNLEDYTPESLQDTCFMAFRDFIPRYITSSCILIQGMKSTTNKKEKDFPISWTITGYPLVSVVIPIIISPKGSLPKICTPNEHKESWLAVKGFELKKHLFPIDVANGHDYINLAYLINKQNTGILQKVRPLETNIIEQSKKTIQSIRNGKDMEKELFSFYQWIDSHVKNTYQGICDFYK